MSLINDMLKDLEKRHAEEAYPKGVVLAGVGVQAPDVRMRGTQWLFYLGGILAVAILVFVFRDGFYPAASLGDSATASQTSEPLPLPLSKPPNRVSDDPAPPVTVASIEPPGDDGILPHSSPEAAAVSQAPDAHADKTELSAVPAVGGTSGKFGETVDEAAAVSRSSAQADDDAPMPDVKQAAAADAPDSGDDAGNAAAAPEANHATDKKTADAAVQVAAAAPVRLKKSIHPLTVKERARQLRSEALRLARRGELDQAEDKLTKALSLEPEHVAARGALAGLMIQNGQLPQAAALLDHGLDLKPGSATLIELRARVYVMQGDNQRARTLLEENAPKVSQDPEYHAMLAAVYQRLGDYDKAGAVYQALVNEKPQNGVWWLGLGLSMEATGKVEEARQAYQKAQVSRVLSPKLRQFVKQKLSSLS